ncbi:MAG TPA: CerR family C-terminal domain-containing protein [Gemmataceae bacterium]|jgi:AcrR family transcriptional regulator
MTNPSPALESPPSPTSTKQRLLEAAEELFAVQGFDGTSVEEITKRAHANRAAVSFHFGGKERLYIEAVKYAHRNCISGAPFPDWPAGTPAEERLRGFIRTMIARMITDLSPASAQLMMREMVQPTAACAEVVREYIRPMADVLVGILAELLPPQVPQTRRYLLGFSIVAQCLFYRTNRPIAALLMGEDEFRRLDVDVLTQHVAAVSLAAVEAVRGKYKSKNPPAAAGGLEGASS